MGISHYSILILENSPENRVLYCRYLSQDQIAIYDVIEAKSGLEALSQLVQATPDLILLDYQLPDMNGLEFLNKLQLEFGGAEIPVIMLAEQGDETIAVAAMKNGVHDYIVKNKLTENQLCCAVHAALDKKRLIKKIRMQEQQQHLLAGISLRIRQFLRLQEILQTAVQEVQKFLNTDRVIVYQFDHQMNGQIVAESVQPPWKTFLNIKIQDTCFQKNQGIVYRDGKIRAISDIYHAGLTECHIDQLEKFQVKANLVVPILLNKKARGEKNTIGENNLISSHVSGSKSSSQVLWGLLIAHQCSTTRQWETNELDLLQQLSVQLAIAIQQAELYENLQNLNASLEQKVEKRTNELQASERRFRAIFNNTFQFTGLLTIEGILLEANQTALNFGGIKLEDVVNRPFWETYWWTISPTTQHGLQQAITRAAQGELIRYEVDVVGAGGKIVTIDFSLRPLQDESRQIVMLIAEGRDITYRKSLEHECQDALAALKTSEAELRGLFNAMADVILVVDKQGRYLKIAPTGADKLYRPAEELIGKTVHEIFPSHLADQFVRVVEQTLATEQTSECEYSLHIGNREICFNAKVSPISAETVIWAARDISRVKRTEIISQQAEKAFQESQILLQVVLDNLPMAIFWKDTNNRYLGCNRQLLLDAGLSSVTEIIGKTDFDMVWREQAPLYQEGDRIVIESGQSKFNIEEPFTKIGNIRRWLRTNKMPLHNPEREIIGVLVSYEDITESKEIELALQESERRYATLATSAPVGIYRTDLAGNCLYVNNQWCENTGLTPQTAAGCGWKKALHPEDRYLVEIEWDHLVQTGETFSLEYRFVRQDGCPTWVFGQAVPEIDSAGTVTGYIGTITDISSRKQAEQERDNFAHQRHRLLQILELQNQTLEVQITQRTTELQQSKERFRNLVETSSDWVWEVNELGIYTYCSPQIINVLGYSPAEVLGKTPFDLMPPAEAQRVFNEFMKFLSVQAPFQCLENTNLHRDGRLITLETSAVPIFDADRQFRGYRGMDRDITLRKLSEATLRQNNARFQKIAANVPGVMYQYILHPDNSHEFIYVSDHCRELYELESATILENANAVFNLTHPDDFPSLQESILRSASSLQQWSWEGRIMTPSGHLKWIQGISQPEQQANGDILWDGLIFDISERARLETERKQIEIAHRNLSYRLDLAIKSAQIGIWDWDIINDLLIWDDRMYELYGVTASDFTHAYQAWETGLHPDDLLSGRVAIQQALDGEKNFDPEFRIVWPDGTIRFIKAYAFVQRDEQGKAQRMIGINFDITERKQGEAKLQDAEIQLRNLSDRLKLAVTSAKIGIWDWDLVNDSLIWDERMYQLFGVSPISFDPSQEAWQKFAQLLHPDDRVNVHETIQQVIAQDKELDTEFRIIWPNGTIRILKAYGLVQRNSQGQPQRMIGINYDISEQQAALRERKLAEAEIIRSRDLREAIFNESADALFLVDIETVTTIDCNQRAVEMFAATNKTDLIGIEGHQLQKEQFTPEDINAIMDEMSIQGFWIREIEYKTFNGELFWGNIAAKEITVAGQKMNLVRVTDISQRKLAETQLQETNKQLATFNEELARATRLKDEFLATMSHELRTPLNAILGLSEGLQDEVFGVINQKQRQGLQTIERSGKHLLELINDILDLSKIEAGQLELHYTPTAINSLCQSSLAFIKQHAFQKGICLEVKIQPNLPEMWLDERRIRQVLINLLNNAVKFTPEGGQIILEVTHERMTPKAEMTSCSDFIHIAVIDTGIGIAPENLHKLFQPFMQIDSSLNRQYTGTGLGLALVKRLVEIHDGQVGVSSKLGVGSCFTVDLPFTHVSDVAPASGQQTSSDFNSIFQETAQQSPLILLAEDNEANIFTISNYLEAIGYRIIVAKTGQEAIALTQAQVPDLILMDIQMPELDGLEAIKRIRVDPLFVNIPIIALTALAMPGDQEQCLAAGANYYLAKPIRIKQLLTIIKQLLTANPLKI